MLQVRRDRAGWRVAVLAALRAVPDWLAARDPGLARLQLAARGTSAVLLTTVLGMVVGGLLHVPVFEFASGITYSLMAPFLTREPTLRARQVSVTLLVLPAMASTVLTALLHGYGPAGDSFFLVLVFLCFLLHPLHPRVIGMGLIAVVITYIGLFLELPPATLPAQLGGIVLAWPVTMFACFVLVPVNPARTLRLAVRAVRWRAARALRPGVDAGRLPRDLVRLNEATLAADDQLALLQPEGREAVRALLIALELTTARLLNVLRGEPVDARQARRQARRLALHGRRLRAGRGYHMDPTLVDPGTVRGLLVQLGHAVHGLGVAAAGMRSARGAAAGVPVKPGPLAWRMAGRVTLASALAMAGGMALSPQRWFWAVITVYLVFVTTRSRGEAITKGAERLAGTLFGIASGLVLATPVAGDPALEAGALLLSVFGMYYWITTSYTVGIFCVTVMLGLIYGMLGASLESLLLLRLEETAIGAAAAVFVAAFVLPQRTRDQVMMSGRGVLTALVAAVGDCRGAMLGRAGAAPLERMRAVDRQVADLRVAIAPLTIGRSFARRTALERPVPALLECVHWARVLAVESQMGAAPGWAVEAVGVVERRLAGVLAGERVAGEIAVHEGALGEALRRLDKAVGLLGERLEIGALEGFGV
jgi:uncharacterized membrane protein YccC